ncbi:MAG: hypothetical protein ABIR32_12510 [Ilumatobacteraceae bacterium]
MHSHRALVPVLTRRFAVRRLVTTAIACCAGVLLTTSGLPLGGWLVPVAHAESEPMTLISQELALAANAPLAISFQLSSALTSTDTITVVVHRRIADRLELADAIDGEYGGIVSIAEIDPTTMAPSENGTVTTTVPTLASAVRTAGSLNFPSPGLYPVTVDVQDQDGNLVGNLLTFVDRLDAAAPSADTATATASGAAPNTGVDPNPDHTQLHVAIAAAITAPPLIPGADTPLPDAVNEQIAELSQYADTVPLSVSISPDVLARLDPKTLSELQPVLARSTMLSQPSIPLDPSAAAAADQAALFSDLLIAGDDLTEQLVGVRPTRTVWLEHEPLTTAGVELLRPYGVNLVVLSPQTYDAVGVDKGYFGAYTLYSLLRNVQLANGAVVPASVVDPRITRHLTNTAMSPEMASLYTAAELVAWRDWLAADFPSLSRNSIVLEMPGGGVLGPDRIARLVQMANATGAVTFDSVDDIVAATDSQLQDGVPSAITLADQQPVDLATRVAPIAAIRARQQTISSLLVEDQGRTDLWSRTIQTLESSSITEQQVDTTIQAITVQFDEITARIVGPANFKFTMNGQSTSLRTTVENLGDEPLNVVIHLGASQGKIEFPDNDQVVTLEPGPNTVTAEVRAKANGSSTILLKVLAPDGTQMAPDSVIEAQVNALTGLAQVLTGGMALVLMTWWVRNQRRNRRNRAAEIALDNHPAGPKPGVPTVAAAAAALATDSAIDSTAVAAAAQANTATATTANSTITAATAIARLDTSGAGDTTSSPTSTKYRARRSGSEPDQDGPGSTTLSDS